MEAKLKFYTGNHKFYCGIDLHARKIYVCILNNSGKIVSHKNIKTDPEVFFELIFPYLEDIVVGVECMFSPEKGSGSSTGNGSPICAANITSHLFSVMRFT